VSSKLVAVQRDKIDKVEISKIIHWTSQLAINSFITKQSYPQIYRLLLLP
jgi:hypothetical protein